MTAKLTWKTFTAADLTADQGKLFAEFQANQAKAKASREALETSIRKAVNLPATLALVFTYRYGAAMAVCPADQANRKGSDKPKTSVADFLKAATA